MRTEMPLAMLATDTTGCHPRQRNARRLDRGVHPSEERILGDPRRAAAP